MIKTVLVDFGNVLVRCETRKDVFKRIVDSFGGNSESVQFLNNEEQAEKMYEKLDTGIINHEDLWREILSQSGISQKDLPFLTFTALSLFHLKPIRRVIDIIRQIQSRYLITAVSNGDFGSEYVYCFLRVYYGITFFKSYMSCKAGLKKPELLSLIVNEFKEYYRITPKECVLIDDNPQNIQAAINLGMYGIQHDSTYESARVLINKLSKIGINVYSLSCH